MKKWTSADLFCGSGGATESFRKALARLNDLDPSHMTAKDWEGFMQAMIGNYIAVNHWGKAIDTHTANYPWAQHYHSELGAIKPLEAIPGGYLDLLLAGPECTYHSNAAGERPINDQSRITAWQVLDWLDKLYVKAFIIENVAEFMKWGPLNKDGHRNKKLQGQIFLQYIAAIKAMGYKVEYKVLCAADYGDPTSRQRLFILGRRDGRRVVWPEPSHASPKKIKALTQPSFFQVSQKPWRTAREIIDWEDKGVSIFDKNLSANTMRRIWAGLIKIGLAPLLVTSGGNEHAAVSVGEPFPTILTREQWAMVEPYLIVNHNHQTSASVDSPVGTIVAGGTHYGVVQPFMLPTEGIHRGNAPRSVDEPVSAVTQRGAGNLVQPFLMGIGGAAYAGKPKDVDEPLNTILAENRIGVALPQFLLGQQSQARPRSVDEPGPTIATAGAISLTQAFMLAINGGPGNERRFASTDEPFKTIVASGNRPALVQPFVMAIDQSQSRSQPVHSADDPLGTIMGKNRFGVVEPYMVPVSHGQGDERSASVDNPLAALTSFHNQGVVQPYLMKFLNANRGQERVSPVDQPMGTITTQNLDALLQPYLIEYHSSTDAHQRVGEVGSPIPTLDTSNRFGLVQPFLVQYYGTGHTANVDSPIGALTSKAHYALCVPLMTGFVLVDILFRMLRPDELALAHSFPTTFVFRSGKKKATKRDTVKMIGNSWPTELGAALCMASMR